MNEHEMITAAARDLVEEVMRSAVALEDVLSGLLADLPDEAFPGEDKGDVLVEMVIGSFLPAALAAGKRDCRVATSLVRAIRERARADLRTAVEMQRRRGGREGPDEGGGR